MPTTGSSSGGHHAKRIHLRAECATLRKETMTPGRTYGKDYTWNENPEGSVVIVADKGSRIGTVTQVMDQVRLAGVEGVAVSAERPDD